MSEIFKDNSPNVGYIRFASELYDKVDALFSQRHVPMADEGLSQSGELILKGEEFDYACSVFNAEGLGPVSRFEIAKVIIEPDTSYPESNDVGSSSVLIKVESGPVEYTYYIARDEGANVTSFDKELEKNPNYQVIETAEDLRIAIEEGRSFEEPNWHEKFDGYAEDRAAGLHTVSLEEQRAIESVLDQLTIKA